MGRALIPSISNTAREPASWLVETVADCLRISPRDLDARTPLTRYGLDSLTSVELMARLSEMTGRELPDGLLFECPDLESLGGFFVNPSSVAAPTSSAGDAAKVMRDDGALPAWIRPEGPALDPGPARAVLLTGATGFLGGELLGDLLRETEAEVHCLVRGDERIDPWTRLCAALEARGLRDGIDAKRVRVVAGDLTRPLLGLTSNQFDALARVVDRIYHAAAVVSWVAPYTALREPNVLALHELLALACRHKATPFHFVSSIAATLVPDGPRDVTENDDMLPLLGRLPLGYAQSKCVAEALARQAAARGLPVTIYRPSLITGDTRSGASNVTDVLMAMIRGCVRMGAAPDLAWPLDGCPVDWVSRAIVRLSSSTGGLRVFHLTSPHVRDWRECVLWMNLVGYRVELLPYRKWLQRLARESGEMEHPLRPLRQFFLEALPEYAGLTRPELYADGRRARVRADITRAALGRVDLSAPRVDSVLLDRYRTWLIEEGMLTVPEWRAAAESPPALTVDAALFGSLLNANGIGSQVREARLVSAGAEHSIIAELTTWRSGQPTGLFRYHLTPDEAASPFDVIVKVKPRDDEVLAIGETVARLCSSALGRAYLRHRDHLGMRLSHRRESAIYAQRDSRFRRHTPALLGAAWLDRHQLAVLVLEDVRDAALMDTADDVSGWRRVHVETALRGLAELHAIWYERGHALAGQPWLGPSLAVGTVVRMRDLWRALADHAAPDFVAWTSPEILAIQTALIQECDLWWRPLEALPRTLIHNDFNPRNLGFRQVAGELRLCLYDWELATLGVPQHDLAELLCFVLSDRVSWDEVVHYTEVHRQALAQAVGRPIDRHAWMLGFRTSIYDLLLNRLPSYAMVQRFRRQAFLPRVVATWLRLYGLLRQESVSGGM
jgi:thioester reductase-like protein